MGKENCQATRWVTRLALELRAPQGSLTSACAGQGRALLSRSRTVGCCVPSVCVLSPLLDCECPMRPSSLFIFTVPSTGPGTRRASSRVNCIFRKCNKTMVWGRREGVYRVIRALKTLYPPSRQYPRGSACLPRGILSED